MIGVDKLQKIVKAAIASLIAGTLVLSLASCGGRVVGADKVPGVTSANRSTSKTQLAGISEVSPPEVIQQLRQVLEPNQPQVKILSPQADEILQDDKVTAKFQVQDLPVFKNQEFDMGPHLHVILDNQPYIAVYDLNQPLVLSDLSPGTHTLRVFASRPWHESFKNEGAYAQTTFHIFTKTDDNNPDPTQPLLTYSRPKGNYGAEPILLDFYLTNAPLHLVAQENSQDEIADWRIRCTINGSSFVIDRWEPIYLKGFKPGKNWVQLEFLDEQGNTVKNAFNNTVRVITYEPNGKDTLSKLTRGELSADAARGIVQPNYTPVTEIQPEPEPEATPEVEETPPAEPTEPAPTPTPLVPTPTPSPEVEETPTEVQPAQEKPAAEIEPLDSTTTPEVPKTEPQKPKGFFNRFRRGAAKRSPIPEVMQSPATEPLPDDHTIPQVEVSPTPQPSETPAERPLNEPAKDFPAPVKETGGYYSRFRRGAVERSPIPEVIKSPTPEAIEPENSLTQPGTLPELQPSETPMLPDVEPNQANPKLETLDQPD